MNKGKFGQGDFTTGEQIGEYSSNREELYITKSGFNSILKDFKMSGAKKEIRKALIKSNILSEKQKRIFGSSYPMAILSFAMTDKKRTSKEIIQDLEANGNLTIESQDPKEIF